MIRGLVLGNDSQIEMSVLNPVTAVGDTMTAYTALFTDPWCLSSAFAAGFVSRLAVTPLVGYRARDKFTTAVTVARTRGVYFAVLAWFYFPVHRRAQWNELSSPSLRFCRTAVTGFVAGAASRMLTNPLLKTRAISTRFGMDLADSARNISMSQLGSAGFFTNEHPVVVNGVYMCLFFLLLESSRRLLDSYGYYPDSVLGQACVHASLAAASCAAASTATYSLSRNVYAGTLLRPSAVLDGRAALLLKEVPMMASFFFFYSLLQPVLCPAHERAGLGY